MKSTFFFPLSGGRVEAEGVGRLYKYSIDVKAIYEWIRT